MVSIILDHVKEVLGVYDSAFDEELLMNINSKVTDLVELGVDEYTDITVEDTTEWVELNNSKLSSSIVAYVTLSTKFIFEPTASGTVQQAYSNTIDKLEGRILVITREGEAL